MTVVDLRDLASVVAGFPLPVAALPASHGGKVACLSLTAAFEQQEIQGLSKRSRRPKRTCAVRLATHLESLEQHDPRRVFVAKRIARLGLNNGEVLREHFERYGPVTEVMLVNSPSAAQAQATRLRPSGMAYVLMQRAADVSEILLDGGELGQVSVGDAHVAISRFWSRAGFASGEGLVGGAGVVSL